MDVKDLQTALKGLTLYKGPIDNKWTQEVREACDVWMLNQHFDGWAAIRLNIKRAPIAAMQMLCRMNGINAGAIDGYVGPSTEYAFEQYDARFSRKVDAEKKVTTWRDAEEKKTPAKQASDKWPTRANMEAFYGRMGTNQTKIKVPYPLIVAWNKKQTLNEITCHKKIAEPTQAALERVLDFYGIAAIKKMRLNLYGGTLNVRKVRGGSLWSIHSWGCAHDFDPERNGLKTRAPLALMSSPEYDYWWESWEQEGAVGQGRALGYDWMHIQFAKY